jgi:hypothetical protein
VRLQDVSSLDPGAAVHPAFVSSICERPEDVPNSLKEAGQTVGTPSLTAAGLDSQQHNNGSNNVASQQPQPQNSQQPPPSTSCSSNGLPGQGQTGLFSLTPATRLGTYHNRNFVQAEAGVQSSVFLLPTVQSDGSVAYAFHHSPQVKIVSPLKDCPSIIPLVSLPPSAGPDSGKLKAGVAARAPRKPANRKTRAPAKILPKKTVPQTQSAVQLPAIAGKAMSLASAQDSGVNGISPLTTKPVLATLANDNGGFVVGFSVGTARGLIQCPGEILFYNTLI